MLLKLECQISIGFAIENTIANYIYKYIAYKFHDDILILSCWVKPYELEHMIV